MKLVELNVDSTNPINLVENVLEYYTLHSFNEGGSGKKLRPILIKALALYVLYGVNKSTKKKIVSLCGLKDYNRIDSLTKELRDTGFLKRNVLGNDHKSFLSDELAKLSEIVKIIVDKSVDMKKSGDDYVSLQINIKLP